MKNLSIYKNIYHIFIAIIVSLILVLPSVSAQTNLTSSGTQVTNNSTNATKVAPNESVPISVKISNFGVPKRVDVTVNYIILDGSGNKINSTSDTVAVDTTATYIKYVHIPNGTKEGTYTAKTELD